MVMVFHASPTLLNGGFLGVDLFFVLSGYLITLHLLHEADKNGHVNLKHFYIRRFLRLMPAFILLIIAFLMLPWVLNLPPGTLNLYLKESLVALLYLANWARAFNVHAPDMLGHTWSLAIEEQFYLLWPFVLVLILRLQHKYSAPTMVIIAASFIALLAWSTRFLLCLQDTPLARLYNGLDTRADALMIGAALAGGMLAINKNNLKLIVTRITRICLLPALAIIIYFALLADWQDPMLYYWKFSLIYFATAIVITFLSLSNKSLLAKALTIKPLIFIGAISYGLYLWHYPVYRVLLLLGMNEGHALLLYGSLISLIIASLSYYLLEKPILKFKSQFR